MIGPGRLVALGIGAAAALAAIAAPAPPPSLGAADVRDAGPRSVCGDAPAAAAVAGPTAAPRPAHDDARIVPSRSIGTPERRPLRGRWRRIADPPFAVMAPAIAWTGSQVIVVDRRRRHVASYDPSGDRWTVRSRSPRRLDRLGPGVWSGTELVFASLRRDATGERELGGLAYDPAADRWRELATAAVATPAPPSSGGSIADATWTGARIAVISSDRVAALYDPAADCWDVLPPVPGEAHGWHVYGDGASLIAETRGDSGVVLASWDAALGRWGEPISTPFDDRLEAREGATWLDGELLYVTWHAGGLEGVLDALFDPRTLTWRTFEHGCRVAGVNPTRAGRPLVAGSARQLLAPGTWTCFDIAPRPRRLLGGGVAWTGEDLIVISGGPGDLRPPRRASFALRAPAWLRDGSADLRDRLAVQDAVLGAVLQADGGAYLVPERGAMPVLLLTGAGEERRRRAIARALPPGVPYEIRLVEHSLAELTELKEAISNDRDALRAEGIELGSVSVHVVANLVEVGVRGLDEPARARLEAYGPAVVIVEDAPPARDRRGRR